MMNDLAMKDLSMIYLSIIWKSGKYETLSISPLKGEEDEMINDLAMNDEMANYMSRRNFMMQSMQIGESVESSTKTFAGCMSSRWRCEEMKFTPVLS